MEKYYAHSDFVLCALLASLGCGGSQTEPKVSSKQAAEAQEETMFGMPLDKKAKPDPNSGLYEVAPPNDVTPTMEKRILPPGHAPSGTQTPPPRVDDPPPERGGFPMDENYQQVRP